MGRSYTVEERLLDMRSDFERLLRSSEPWSAVSALARDHWDRPDEVMAALFGCSGFCTVRSEIKTIGIYYSGMGTGGAERVTRDLMVLWESMGYRVVFLCNEGLETSDQYEMPGSVVRVPLPTCFGVGPDTYDVRARALSEALGVQKIDILVYGQWLSVTLPWDVLVCKALGVPVVIQTHGTFGVLAGYGRPEFLRLCETYAHADAITCLSHADRTFWLQFNPKTFYIPNPLDSAFINADPALLEGRHILWAGRIAPDKNPFTMLEVFSRVCRLVPDASLSMVGPVDCATRTSLMKRARELRVEPALSLPGNIAADDMAEVYRRASILVMTSRYEGYPTVLAEAQAMGVPTVMYDLPYLMLAQGDCGVTRVPMDDVDSLARAVSELLLDDERRRAEGSKARRSFRDRFADSVKLGVEWQAVFDAALEGVNYSDNPFCSPWYLMWRTFRSSIVDELSALDERVRACSALERDAAEACGREEWERERALEAQAHGAQLEKELEDIRESVSFKVGRLLTLPMRKVRDLFRG